MKNLNLAELWNGINEEQVKMEKNYIDLQNQKMELKAMVLTRPGRAIMTEEERELFEDLDDAIRNIKYGIDEMQNAKNSIFNLAKDYNEFMKELKNKENEDEEEAE